MTVNTGQNERLVWRGNRLAVFWLVLPTGKLPAREEYEEHIDPLKAMARFAVIDALLSNGERVPTTNIQKVAPASCELWEVKAPPRGRQIGRLLCHRVTLSRYEWELYVALCGRKKQQDLPRQWIETACRRIRSSLEAGGP